MSQNSATSRALIFLFLLAAIVMAQSQRGTLTGTVSDKSGAVIPGAKVVITATATNTTFTTESGDAGQFTVPNMNPGDYSIRVEKEGFKPAVTTGLKIDAGATVRSDVSLEIGSAAQAIEVTGERGSTPDRERQEPDSHHRQADSGSADRSRRILAQPIRSRDPRARIEELRR